MLKRFFLVGLLLVATPAINVAQTFYGGVRGAIRDATGVVPGAALTLTNEATAVSLTTVTNDVGEYAFPNTPPGVYTLAATLGGYKTFERRQLIIGTQQILVVDVALEVGEVAEQITVTGETPALDRSSASVASMIDRSALENLPSTGRNPFLFSTTIPNVIPVGTPFFTRMQDQNATSLLSIAGAPPRANTYLLDGVPITDLLNRAAMIPSTESLEEVSVQVNTYDASFGRSGGGVFNATHRAGTNRWSGSGLVRNRPDWGLANTYFASQANLPRPSSYNYLWAGALGGPIVRGRTFVFATTEGYKTREIREFGLTLPTALERTGDFSRSVDASGRPIVIYDPLTTRLNPSNPGQSIRDPFPGNIIPADRIDPVARELLRRYPLPDSGRSATRSKPVSDLANQATVKLDHQISRGVRSSGTFAWYGSTEPSPHFYDGLESDPFLADVKRQVRVFALNNLFTPGGATVYELRYGYVSFADDLLVPTFDVGQLGFAPRYTSALAASQFPSISLVGYSAMGAGFPRQLRFPSHTLNGTVTRLVGSHTVKAGADYRMLGLEAFDPGSTGNYAFTQGFTQGPNPNAGSTTAGDAVASLLLGVPSAGNVAIGTPLAFNAHYYAAFVQDDVRVSPNVTLNLGVRYEYESGLGETNNQFTVGFDRDRPFPDTGAGPDPEGRTHVCRRGRLPDASVGSGPRQVRAPRWCQLGPRGADGRAWRLWPLLGAAPVPVPLGEHARHARLLGDDDLFRQRGWRADTLRGLRPARSVSRRHGAPARQRPGLITGAGGDIHFNDQSRRSPYLHKFSVDVQHELPLAITLRAGYLASRAERLDVGGTSQAAININQIDPAYQSLGSALQEIVPNPFSGNASFGAFSTQPHLTRSAASPLSTVRQRLCASGQRRPLALSLVHPRRPASDARRLGRRRELHLEPPRRQPDRRAQLLLRSRGRESARAQQLRSRCRVRPVAG